MRNKWRKDFISRYIPSLIESQNVQFHKTAYYLNAVVKVESNVSQIEDFYRESELDYEKVAMLLVLLLPKKKKLRLCIDRTEWDFGSYQANILMVICGDSQLQIPLYWELLDNKSGNSNAKNRIDLLKLCVAILGKERIGLVIGGGEFVGHQWFRWLKDEGINFCMRMPKNHHIERLEGQKQTAEDLLKANPSDEIHLKDCLVDGVWAHVFIKKIPLKRLFGRWCMGSCIYQKIPPTQKCPEDILFIFGSSEPKIIGKLYKKRWCIEACFQNLKSRGRFAAAI